MDPTAEGWGSHSDPDWRHQSWVGSPSCLRSAWPTTSLGVAMTPPFSGLIIPWNDSQNSGWAVRTTPVLFIVEAAAQGQPDGGDAAVTAGGGAEPPCPLWVRPSPHPRVFFSLKTAPAACFGVSV